MQPNPVTHVSRPQTNIILARPSTKDLKEATEMSDEEMLDRRRSITGMPLAEMSEDRVRISK